MAEHRRTLTWLHLSDAHLPPGDEDSYRVDKALGSLIDTLRDDSGKGGTPDLIFFTGDLAAKGICYAKARGFFDDLLDATGLKKRLGKAEAKRRLFVVPGNHDVDRSKTKFLLRSLATQEDCDGFFEPEAVEDRARYFDRFHAFAAFFNEYFRGLRQLSADGHFLAEVLELGEERANLRVGVLGLNSAWFSQDDQDHGRLWVGERTCDLALEKINDGSSCDLLIVLTHHPVTWLTDDDEKPVRGFLGSRYAVHLFGHDHRAATGLVRDESGERLSLCTGALFESAGKPKRALWGLVDWPGKQLQVRPIRYEPGPPPRWTIDTSLYPDCGDQGYCKTFDLPRRRPPRRRRGRPATAPGVADYLKALCRRTSYIDITGMRTGSGEAYSLPIDDIYIPLTTSAPRAHAGGNKAGLDVRQEGQSRRVELHEVLSNLRTVLVGDPGAGKSTFLRRVANWCCRKLLDGEELGVPEGPCFPLLVRIPRLLEFMKVNSSKPWAPGHPDTPCWLAQYCGRRCIESNQALDESFFQGLLAGGEALVLLDGLDEAPTAGDRANIRHWLEEVSAAYAKCRFVVTTRPAGHRGTGALNGFSEVEIDPLEEDAIRTFFGHWCHALYRSDPVKADRNCSELVGAYHSRPEIRRLARNPVMLTAIAALHHNRKKLPEQRADLYESIIEWLSTSREDKPGRARPERCVALLQNVALSMQAHAGGRKEQMARQEAARAIRSSWRGVSDDEAQAEAERFLEEEESDSGIIVKRREDVSFWHLTFQEFLAARALAARDADRAGLLGSDLIYKPEWREVMLLLGGVLYGHGQERVDSMFSTVLDALSPGAPLERKARCVGLLGAAIRDLSPVGFRPSGEAYEEALGQVLGVFEAERSRGIDVTVAIEAAEALGQAADPRFADPLAPLRDPDHARWIRIPAGEFWMGAQKQDPSGRNYDPEAQGGETYWPEGPVHGVTLSEYRIGKHPVTVCEYAKFVEEAGYGEESFWEAGGFGEFDKPGGWDEQREHPTRPVVNVSWYEACAYAAWATSVLRKAKHDGQIRLPTEAEWERAARGTEGRKYPWASDEPKARLLNFGGNVGNPTPVGVYPLGATPEGICDLAGNVWEWCRDWYGADYYASAETQDPQGPRSGGPGRVLRGGSWFCSAGRCRSAYRHWFIPEYRSDFFGFRVVLAGRGLPD